jgi:hypothetical protein
MGPAFFDGMRLRTTLLHVAVLLTAGCGGSTANGGGGGDAGTSDGKGGTDAVAKDGPSSDAGEAGEPAEAACGGCNCGQPQNPSGNASPQQACELAASFQGSASGSDTACNTYCESINADAGAGGYFCTLPTAYINAYDTAAGDSGASGGADSGADGGLQCPAWTGTVLVECGYECLGRRTAGIAEPARSDGAALGEVFAGRAYLEEVSVHAFARLERELAAHGAPAALLRDARRARRDEVRHTAMMARLARRFGAAPRSPGAPGASPVRSLLEIAVENAVEGCVRETYGAVIGLVEARRSSDAHVRRAMTSIGADECRHAELAWAVARWVMPRLDAAQRAQVQQAAREAVAALAREGDARVVAMLDEQVWDRAA